MAYVKPNNFVDNTDLTATDINGNDEALKKYENQDIDQADYAANAFGTEEIQLGDYQPITQEYTFASGIAAGIATDSVEVDRAYWTSTIKKARMNDNTLPVWTSLYQTAPDVYIERPADVLITFGGNSFSAKNSIAASGFWDTTMKLGYTKDNDDQLIFVEQSRAYSFEQAAMSATPSGNNNPFGNSGTPSSAGDEDPEVGNGCRRWIGWSIILSGLSPGHYKFSIYVNAKVEEGFVDARTFKAEVFWT